MSNFNQLLEDFQSGGISATDFYDQLPLDLQKSVMSELSKAHDDDDKDEKEMRDEVFEDKEDLDKNTTMGGITAAPPSPQMPSAEPLARSLDGLSGNRAQLSKSQTAQLNRIASQYGGESFAKSVVSETQCLHCNKLHKSVGNICNSCQDTMKSVQWHTGTHLE